MGLSGWHALAACYCLHCLRQRESTVTALSIISVLPCCHPQVISKQTCPEGHQTDDDTHDGEWTATHKFASLRYWQHDVEPSKCAQGCHQLVTMWKPLAHATLLFVACLHLPNCGCSLCTPSVVYQSNQSLPDTRPYCLIFYSVKRRVMGNFTAHPARIQDGSSAQGPGLFSSGTAGARL